ncbi:hypothetical protein BT67DRAFT_123752 [Trichocladium antarcticum]|uniref:Uncharacterized protein n=1 Tax=Trichocladium antarcticum TaxID=1450529 RepID=A0AAN6ZHL1_9PEZI|nr:hypothetical protein BT67DRAFT_123752 [Trichocladium antarcticum]
MLTKPAMFCSSSPETCITHRCNDALEDVCLETLSASHAAHCHLNCSAVRRTQHASGCARSIAVCGAPWPCHHTTPDLERGHLEFVDLCRRAGVQPPWSHGAGGCTAPAGSGIAAPGIPAPPARPLAPWQRSAHRHQPVASTATSLPGGLSPGFTSHSNTPDLLITRSPLFDTRDSLNRVLSQAPGAPTRTWWVLSHLLIFSYRRSPVRPSSLRRAVETVPKTARRLRGLASAHHGPRCLFLRPDPMLRSSLTQPWAHDRITAHAHPQRAMAAATLRSW